MSPVELRTVRSYCEHKSSRDFTRRLCPEPDRTAISVTDTYEDLLLFLCICFMCYRWEAEEKLIFPRVPDHAFATDSCPGNKELCLSRRGKQNVRCYNVSQYKPEPPGYSCCCPSPSARLNALKYSQSMADIDYCLMISAICAVLGDHHSAPPC